MDPELFYDRYVKEDFETGYVPGAFKGICRQYLIRQNRRGRLEEPFEKIGMIEAEIAQVKAAGLECYKYGFISRAGFTAQQAENQIFITLDDLYAVDL